MHIFSTLSTTTTRTSISLFLHFQSAEYIGERVREIAQPFLFVYIHLYVVFSRRFLSSNSVCVRYRKQKWEKTNPTECLSPCRGRGAYGGGGYHIFPFSEEQLWISSPSTKNKQTLIQAERTGALAAPARAHVLAAFVPAVLVPRFCVDRQMQWYSKGLFNLRAPVRLSVCAAGQRRDNK